MKTNIALERIDYLVLKAEKLGENIVVSYETMFIGDLKSKVMRVDE